MLAIATFIVHYLGWQAADDLGHSSELVVTRQLNYLINVFASGLAPAAGNAIFAASG